MLVIAYRLLFCTVLSARQMLVACTGVGSLGACRTRGQSCLHQRLCASPCSPGKTSDSNPACELASLLSSLQCCQPVDSSSGLPDKCERTHTKLQLHFSVCPFTLVKNFEELSTGSCAISSLAFDSCWIGSISA